MRTSIDYGATVLQAEEGLQSHHEQRELRTVSTQDPQGPALSTYSNGTLCPSELCKNNQTKTKRFPRYPWHGLFVIVYDSRRNQI